MDYVFRDDKTGTFLAGSVPNSKSLRVVGHYSDSALLRMPDNERHHVSAGIYPALLANRDESQIEKVPCIVFDDVGRPAPVGAIPINPGVEIEEDEFAVLPEPTWRMETSLGLYQYGYGFDPMPDLATAKLIHAQLKAHPVLGKGLHSVGQYFRLPSGSNTKPGRGNFKTRLVSVGPIYTVEEFARGFGLSLVAVPPVAAQAASIPGQTKATAASIEAILNDLPNDQYFDSYDEWIKVGHAIYGASHGSDEGRLIWHQWSATHASYDEALTEQKWDSFTGAKASASTLRRIVEDRYGRDSDEYRRASARIAFDAENAPPLDEAHITATAVATKLGDIFDSTPYAFSDPKKIPPREWLYGKAYIRRFVSGLVAPGGTGKTSLSFVEALAMASGKDLLGIQPRVPLRVQIWNGEDPKEELDRRLAAIALHYGITNADIGDRLFVQAQRDKAPKDRLITATMAEGSVKIQRPVMDRVIAHLKHAKLDVLKIDPFITSHKVPENSNDAIDAVVKEWVHVAEVCNVSILLVHHLRKMDLASTEVTADDARGASAYRDALRVLRLCAAMPAKIAAANGITNPRAYFRVVDGKASMSPAAAGDDWYRFVSVSLGNGVPFPADGTPSIPDDHVGVVTKWAGPAAPQATTNGELQSIQKEIGRGGPWRQDVQSPDWIGVPIGRALGLDVGEGLKRADLTPEQTAARQRVGASIKDWLKKGWLKIDQKRDHMSKLRSCVEIGDLWEPENETTENVFPPPE